MPVLTIVNGTHHNDQYLPMADDLKGPGSVTEVRSQIMHYMRNAHEVKQCMVILQNGMPVHQSIPADTHEETMRKALAGIRKTRTAYKRFTG